MDSRGRNPFTTKVKYECHILIFMKLTPAQQPFVNNHHSNFHENLLNGLGADMWSQMERRDRHGLHIKMFFNLLPKECLTTVTSHTELERNVNRCNYIHEYITKSILEKCHSIIQDNKQSGMFKNLNI